MSMNLKSDIDPQTPDQQKRNKMMVLYAIIVLVAVVFLAFQYIKASKTPTAKEPTNLEEETRILVEVTTERMKKEVEFSTIQKELETAREVEEKTKVYTQELINGTKTEVVDFRDMPVSEEEPVVTPQELPTSYNGEATLAVASLSESDLPVIPLDEKLIRISGYLTQPKISSPIPAEVFIETERNMNCDADLLVAITGADSSYGKATLTSYNPGNVGNTDGGGRMYFESWQEGVNAVCGALNNQHLGDTYRIGELSNGGRLALGLPECGGGATNVMPIAWNHGM